MVLLARFLPYGMSRGGDSQCDGDDGYTNSGQSVIISGGSGGNEDNYGMIVVVMVIMVVMVRMVVMVIIMIVIGMVLLEDSCAMMKMMVGI